MRGFDAGTKHNFSITNGADNPGLYDGQIDTWACDVSQGFIGHGSSISGAYSDYKLPNSPDDCREDRYQGEMTVDAWNLTIYPDTDPQLAWNGTDYQINPYVKVFMLNRIYLPRWRLKLQRYFQDFQIAVETIFNTRSSYMQ
ncbi:MAG: hypothetical protein LBO09_01800 [Candidatus Peribacteria bacterium]|nr:hypothetical protein [Candidatus Peribacteria bacterium]